MAIHAWAEAAAQRAGLNKEHAEEILLQISKRNPALLIGGFTVDVAIIGVWLALMEEDFDTGDSANGYVLSDDEINQRVDETLQVMYAGLV